MSIKEHGNKGKKYALKTPQDKSEYRLSTHAADNPTRSNGNLRLIKKA